MKHGTRFLYVRKGFHEHIYTLCHLAEVNGWILVTNHEGNVTQWMAVTNTAEEAFGNCRQYFIEYNRKIGNDDTIAVP